MRAHTSTHKHVCMDAHAHTHTNTHMHTHTHTHAYTSTHVYMHTHPHINMYVWMHMHTHTHIHKHTHAHTHTCTNTHIHNQTCTHAHKHTCTSWYFTTYISRCLHIQNNLSENKNKSQHTQLAHYCPPSSSLTQKESTKPANMQFISFKPLSGEAPNREYLQHPMHYILMIIITLT